MCPHAPDDHCACRKPEPGLLLQAAEELSLDLQRSIMIGDALTDLEAGRAAGVGAISLVETGRGASQARLPGIAQLPDVSKFATLSDALAALIPTESQQAQKKPNR
jgi:D-glycero-D-manno-heptose 1,7-bisphosphate phosphatase